MQQDSQNSRLQLILGKWLGLVVGYPWIVIGLILLLSGGALNYTAKHLGVNTDTADMLDAGLPFRQTFDRFRREFPTLANNLLVVIEAPTAEQARSAAAQVKTRLLADQQHFAAVDWLAGEAYFQDNGLLFLTTDELTELGDQLSAAQPFLNRLAEDMQAATLLELLAEAGDYADAQPAELDHMLAAIAQTINQVLADQSAPMSWEQVFFNSPGNNPPPEVFRETLVVEPRLNFAQVMAGRDVMAAAGQIRKDLQLTANQPVRMLLTGPVALEHEELLSALTGAKRAGILAIVLVALVMLWALRSVRLVMIALLSLTAGFALTLGFAAWAVGRINLISIAFTVLYIGLGVNYGIHFMLRYREQLIRQPSKTQAIITSAKLLSGALALSAITTAIGFFAFMPTAFRGVAELGLIAGVAMFITFAISYSLLPALLAVTPPPRIRPDRKNLQLPPALLDGPLRYRNGVRIAALLTALTSAVLAWQLPFDSDPLNLRDPQSESVSTLRQLLSSQSTGHRNLQVLGDSAEQARQTTAQLRSLPEVDRAVSLLDLVPVNQEEKLLLLEDLRWTTGLDFLTVPDVLAEPDGQRLDAAIGQLTSVLPQFGSPAADRLQASLTRLQGEAADGYEKYTAFNHSLVSLLPDTLRRLQRVIGVDQPVSRADLPEHISDRWLSEAGTYIVQIFPAGDTNDFAYVRNLIDKVSNIAPQVTGMPVLQQRSGQAVSTALQQAMLWAVLGIGLILLLILRSIGDSARVLVPLLLGGLVTGAILVIIGVPLNFANVVALPLLLGVAVDNGVHLVYRHRSLDMPTTADGGLANVLRTTTARGIVFGALTTVLSFGNLMFSTHTGTASMGLLLALGLSLMVTATLLVLPALLPAVTMPTDGETDGD